ncbi:MAG: hypothetical protein KAU90_08405 [Sulfurovaceae bacterium]|nr:hypothetical protein [Sulfurovaceae bacterium]
MRFFSLSIIIMFLSSGCSLLSHKIQIKSNEPIKTTPAITIITKNQKEIPIVEKKENKKLKKLMRKFDDLIFTKINSEVEEGEEDMFLDKHIRAELKEYLKDIDKIKTLYPDADDEYIRLTKKLKKESTKLYKIIKIKKTEWVKPQLENVINVCNQCHNLY